MCVREREGERERESQRYRQTDTHRQKGHSARYMDKESVCVRERERERYPHPLPRRLITLSCLYFIANSRGVSSTGEGVRGRSGALSDNSILQQST